MSVRSDRLSKAVREGINAHRKHCQHCDYKVVSYGEYQWVFCSLIQPLVDLGDLL